MSENKDRFVSLVRSINREGINELVEFLEKIGLLYSTGEYKIPLFNPGRVIDT